MFKEAFTLTKETFQDWSQDKAPRLAAALAYYTIFSIAPLLILVISIAGLVAGSNAMIQQQLFKQIGSLVGQNAATAVQGIVTNQLSHRASNIIATIIGIVTLFLGATGVFLALQDALNTIWEVEPKKGGAVKELVRNRVLSFAMILGVAFILLVSLVISAVLSALGTFFQGFLPGGSVVWQVVNFVISLAVVSLIFAMIFKYLPDVKVDWKDVWIGAVITAILFNIGKFLIGLYLGNSTVSSAYGAAGSLVVVLLWIYYSAQILFIGAEFTQVYARHHKAAIEPSEHAQKISTEDRAHQGLPTRKTPPAPVTPVYGQRVQEVMVPVTAQPKLHADEPDEEEKISYSPPNSAAVVPVIGLGMLAGLATIYRVVNKVVDTVRQ